MSVFKMEKPDFLNKSSKIQSKVENSSLMCVIYSFVNSADTEFLTPSIMFAKKVL